MKMRSKSIRLLIASTSPLRMAGLSALLSKQAGMVVAGGCSKPSNLAATVSRLGPDILVVDEHSAREIWIRHLARITNREGPPKIILMCDFLPPERIFELVQLGVDGMVLQDAPTETLYKCIRAVTAGQYWIGRDRVIDVMDYFRRQRRVAKSTSKAFGLRAQEFEIIRFLVRGYTNQEIAEHLAISNQAARHRVSRLFEKLDVSNRLELVLVAVQNGLWQERESADRLAQS